MKPGLKKRIKEFNKIKFSSVSDKRIILATLHTESKTVTTAS